LGHALSTATTPRRPLGQVGQELPFDDSGKQPTERLLCFGTCRKANSHISAIAVITPSGRELSALHSKSSLEQC